MASCMILHEPVQLNVCNEHVVALDGRKVVIPRSPFFEYGLDAWTEGCMKPGLHRDDHLVDFALGINETQKWEDRVQNWHSDFGVGRVGHPE